MAASATLTAKGRVGQGKGDNAQHEGIERGHEKREGDHPGHQCHDPPAGGPARRATIKPSANGCPQPRISSGHGS